MQEKGRSVPGGGSLSTSLGNAINQHSRPHPGACIPRSNPKHQYRSPYSLSSAHTSFMHIVRYALDSSLFNCVVRPKLNIWKLMAIRGTEGGSNRLSSFKNSRQQVTSRSMAAIGPTILEHRSIGFVCLDETLLAPTLDNRFLRHPPWPDVQQYLLCTSSLVHHSR